MILKRFFPSQKKEFLKIITDNILIKSQNIAMQAGHFLIYYDNTENNLLPCIESELNNPRLAPIGQELGRFPLLSWQLGLELLNNLKAHKKQILVLVNDWQYLPPAVNRAAFYEKFSQLPQSYHDAMVSSESTISLLSPIHTGNSLDTGEFFSEQALRNSYGKNVKQMIKNGEISDLFELSTDGQTVKCSTKNMGSGYQEVYCTGKSQNCNHEVAELIKQVYEISQSNIFINLFPQSCQESVEQGTELGLSLFNPGLNLIINIAMPAINVNTIHDLINDSSITFHASEKGGKS